MQDLTLFNTDSAKAITQDIQVFNCELGSIRAIVKNCEPLFCLADLAHSLDFRDGASLKKPIVAEFELYDFKSYPLQTNQGMQKYSSFVSITTLEIAELCGKEHKNVLRDCDEQLIKIVESESMPKFEHTYTHPRN